MFGLPPEAFSIGSPVAALLGVFWMVMRGTLWPARAVKLIQDDLDKMTRERDSWQAFALKLLEQNQQLIQGATPGDPLALEAFPQPLRPPERRP